MVALFMGLFNNLSELVNKLVIFVGTFQQMHNQVQWVTHKLPVIDNFVGIKSLITQTTIQTLVVCHISKGMTYGQQIDKICSFNGNF